MAKTIYYVIHEGKVVRGKECENGTPGTDFILNGKVMDSKMRKEYSSYEADALDYVKDWNERKQFVGFFEDGTISIGTIYFSTNENMQIKDDGIYLHNLGNLIMYRGNNTTIKELSELYKKERFVFHKMDDIVWNNENHIRWAVKIDLKQRAFEIFNDWAIFGTCNSKMIGSIDEDGHITDYKWEA